MPLVKKNSRKQVNDGVSCSYYLVARYQIIPSFFAGPSSKKAKAGKEENVST